MIKYKVGGTHEVWWNTGVTDETGEKNLATILDVRPYEGIMEKYGITHVLKLSAPETKRGWMEMSV